MNIQRLLSVEPRDLSYAIELKKQPSCSVKLSNKTQDHIAFKVKTTSVGKYRVRPYIGNLSPGSSCDILVKVLNPFNTQHEDTFMMMGIVSSPGATMEDIQKLFKANVGLRVQKSILGVAYVLTPKVPQLVAQESTSSSRFETSVGELLDIRPSELRFPFEVKELSCSLQMSNMTNNHVGFKVRTTALDKYSVQPNIGIVLPRSTCDITVRILAHTEILTNMKCEDKFIIKSIIASPFETPKDMFERRAGVVDKINLGVFYVPPQRWSYTEFNGIRGINEIEPGEFYAPPSRGESRNFIQQFIGTTRAAYETEVEESFVRPSRSSYSEGLKRYLSQKGVIIGLLGPIVLYHIWKMLPFIWSLTVWVMQLMVKMMQKIVSDSVEDWIVNICTPYLWAFLVCCMNCLPVIFGCSIPFLPVLFRRQ